MAPVGDYDTSARSRPWKGDQPGLSSSATLSCELRQGDKPREGDIFPWQSSGFLAALAGRVWLPRPKGKKRGQSVPGKGTRLEGEPSWAQLPVRPQAAARNTTGGKGEARMCVRGKGERAGSSGVQSGGCPGTRCLLPFPFPTSPDFQLGAQRTVRVMRSMTGGGAIITHTPQPARLSCSKGEMRLSAGGGLLSAPPRLGAPWQLHTWPPSPSQPHLCTALSD